MKNIFLTHEIPLELAGWRLDQALAQLFPDYSRSQIQNWIKDGQVKLDNTVILRPREKVLAQQHVEINAELNAKENWQPQAIPLDIIYEDDQLLIVNKAAGITVHPGAGTPDQTLVNALLHQYPELAVLPRAGLIHRLDKDTTGLLVVARNLSAHHHLVKAMQKREIKRCYEAIVDGVLIAGGCIEAPIGRHPFHRTRMDVVESGRPATTHYRVVERFRKQTRVRIQLETGRTHQIRVHFAYIGYPIVGDPLYNKRGGGKWKFQRQALHAYELELIHPQTHQLMTWQAPLPQDMEELLTSIRAEG